MALLSLLLVVPAFARLGEPNISNASISCQPSAEELLPGGKARGAEYWEHCAAENATRSGYYHNPSLRKLEDIMRRSEVRLKTEEMLFPCVKGS